MYIAVVLSRFTLLYVKFLELAKLKLYHPKKDPLAGMEG